MELCEAQIFAISCHRVRKKRLLAGQLTEPYPDFSGRKDTGSAATSGSHQDIMKDKSNLRIDEIIDSVYSDFFGDDVLTKMTKKRPGIRKQTIRKRTIKRRTIRIQKRKRLKNRCRRRMLRRQQQAPHPTKARRRSPKRAPWRSWTSSSASARSRRT